MPRDKYKKWKWRSHREIRLDLSWNNTRIKKQSRKVGNNLENAIGTAVGWELVTLPSHRCSRWRLGMIDKEWGKRVTENTIGRDFTAPKK